MTTPKLLIRYECECAFKPTHYYLCDPFERRQLEILGENNPHQYENSYIIWKEDARDLSSNIVKLRILGATENLLLVRYESSY